VTRASDTLRSALKTLLPDIAATHDWLVAIARVYRVGVGEQIIQSDDKNSEVFLLLEGQAKAMLYSEQGGVLWFNDFAPGEFFGELAAISGERRNADVQAVSAVLLAAIPGHAFVDRMRSDPVFGWHVTRLITRRFRQTSARMFELSAMSVRGRLYFELLRISRSDTSGKGATGADARIIDALPSMTALAEHIHSSRESVSRTVSDLEAHGLITREGRRIMRLNQAFFSISVS
jgi:CRP/FNR family transcriptional regulator, cyclic AMP receptor protein